MLKFSGVLPFGVKLTGNCAVLSDYYDLVQEKIIDAEKFDKALVGFLENGVDADTEKLWNTEKTI